MFKNMKRLAALSLPLVALSLASCNNGPKYISYDKMRRFASETYDQYALDAVPATFTTNLNKVEANVVIDYKTPEGGSDSLVFSFGFSGVHVVVKDQYAYCLSSTLVDMIEQYYSDFAGIALSLKEEPPVQLNYELIGGNRSKVGLTASENLVGSVLVKLLQLGAGVLDAASAYAGFIPFMGGTEPQKESSLIICQAINGMLKAIQKFYPNLNAPVVRRTILAIMDYAKFTVSNSSKSNGEVFNTYITTDDYGFLNKFVFDFKSDFVITGLAQFKNYGGTPKEGDQPTVEAPYQFTMTGSIDFDIDIVSEY